MYCNTYDIPNFVSGASLRVYFQNVGGMRTKSKDFLLATSRLDYDVYVIVETWLNEGFFDEEYFDPKLFLTFRKDRDFANTGQKKGGGVLIAVNRSLHSLKFQLHNQDTLLDQLCVCVSSSSGSTFICCSYIPPNSGDCLYNGHVENIVNLCETHTDANFCILGDFNLPDIVWSDFQYNGILTPTNVTRSNENSLIDNTLSCNLIQINNLFNTLSRLLDLIFVDENLIYQLSESTFPVCLSDRHHIPIAIHLHNFDAIPTSPALDNSSFNFRSTDFGDLNNVLFEINWENIFPSNDVSVCYDIFLSNLTETFQSIVPRFGPRLHKLPWYNKTLKRLKNKRNKLNNFFKADSDNILLREQFTTSVRQFNVLDKFLYNRYMGRLENELKENPKAFWNFIRSKRGSTNIPICMSFNGVRSQSLPETVELFADFFKSNFDDATVDLNDSYSRSGLYDGLEFGSLVISGDDVSNAMSSLKPSLKCDSDGLCAFVLKFCSLSLCIPLRHIFNLSLSSGTFIDRWKKFHLSNL
ncbi:uncharacterized protein [Eurosta solidaginis]|uniref:uncharacterized protein isoform X1 n=1 Tax=Eurosta solidaginis TaxID=178769 RepID=UPI0035316681